MEGTIVSVEPGPAATRLTLDLTSGGGARAERVVLVVSPDTVVEVRLPDGTTRRGGAADLVVGARVQARHAGAELRSLPPQYLATGLRVLAGP